MDNKNSEVIETVWPGSRRVREQVSPTTGLSDLNGKVVAEVWDRVFRGDQMFPHIRNVISQKYPGVKFVHYDEFGDIFGWNEREVVEKLPDLFRMHEVDAVIVGVGA